MTLRNHLKSASLFAAVTILPIVKIYLLGLQDGGAQSEYIRVYFWLQFLSPTIDFGYYWSGIRLKLEGKPSNRRQFEVSMFGLIAALCLLNIDLALTFLAILGTLTAWYNNRLQIFRIEGDASNYYRLRLGKVGVDLVLVMALFSLSVISVEKLLMVEIFAILTVGSIVGLRGSMKAGVGFFSLGRLFTLDYLYTLVKVARANFVRLGAPLVFIGVGLEPMLFVILIYELVAQYLSIEKIKDLLNGTLYMPVLIGIYFVSLPFQYMGILWSTEVLGWYFSPLEIFCVLLGGGARIFAVYSLRAVKLQGFNVILSLNVIMVLFGVVLFFSFFRFAPAELEIAWVLFFYYGFEALVSLLIILTFERKMRA